MPNRETAKTAEFRHFLDLARLMQTSVHRAERLPERIKGEYEMYTFSNFANRAAAAVASLAMTAFLFVGYTYTPSAQIVAGMVA